MSSSDLDASDRSGLTDSGLDGRVAIVTGGASGIGLGATRALLRGGASVVVVGNVPDEVDGAVADLGVAPSRLIAVHADVTDSAALSRVVERCIAWAGRLDIVVSAAGIQRYGDAVETTEEQWNTVFDVNVKGAFLMVKAALPHLRHRGSGAIVLVSSVQAFVTQAGVAAYTSSKGALNALGRSLAIDEARYGIRVNTVCPGSVDTPMLRASAKDFSDGSRAGIDSLMNDWGRSHPLGRVARPDEVGEAIAFLASDRASFITGVALPVDGGLLASVAVALPE